MPTAPRKEDRFSWTPAAVETLCRMWGEGETAAAIARAIGCGRNAVIGKKNRLKLTHRPSPIGLTREQGNTGAARGTKWLEYWADGSRDAIVRRGYSKATAMPVAIIANTIGCSMTSVTKRAKELGLTHPGLTGVGMLKAKGDTQAKNVVLRHPRVAPGSRAASLGDLKAGECLFPVTPHNARHHLFCGAPKGHGPYCPFHSSIAFFALEQKEAA